MKWNRFLQRLHIFCGLYAAPFLILMGTSAFLFNHEALMPSEDENKVVTHQHVLTFSGTLPNEAIWDTVKASVDIYGYVPFWLHYRDKQGDYHFQVHRPGRKYFITAAFSSGTLVVKEEILSYRQIIASMHPLIVGGQPDALLKPWAVYGQTAALATFITLLLTLYFWTKRSWKKPGYRVGIMIGISFSVMLIMWIWLS